MFDPDDPLHETISEINAGLMPYTCLEEILDISKSVAEALPKEGFTEADASARILLNGRQARILSGTACFFVLLYNEVSTRLGR